MIRITLVALTVYVYGTAPFDGLRPLMLDEPVRAFHADVNATAYDGIQALREVNRVREMRYLQPHIDNFRTFSSLM